MRASLSSRSVIFDPLAFGFVFLPIGIATMGIDMDLEGIPSLIEIHGNESGGASEGMPGLEAPHIDGLLAIDEQYIPIYNIPSCDCIVFRFAKAMRF